VVSLTRDDQEEVCGVGPQWTGAFGGGFGLRLGGRVFLLLRFPLSESVRRERSRKRNKEEDRKETKEVGTRKNGKKKKQKKKTKKIK
jgi:hypothetical protein